MTYFGSEFERLGRQERPGGVHGGINMYKERLLVSWLAKKQKKHSKSSQG